MDRYFIILLLFIPVYSYSHNNTFALQNQVSSRISVDTTIENNTNLFPFYTKNTINRFTFSGEITLHSDTSLVRIILVDDNHNEYLIYETYPILAGSRQFSVDQAGEETSLLNNIIPSRITLELINASIYLKDIILSEEDKYKAELRDDRLHLQILNKIDQINQNIQNTGQKWVAGETSISKLSYQEKKRMFGGRVPNFQGFEYYVGGVFVLPGAKDDLDSRDTPLENLSLPESQYASEFSWKNRHGEDWVTPVKSQGGCNACWAFGSTAAVELMVNLYFNRHLDYDLSEQNLISCTNWNCIFGGTHDEAFDYIRNTGIVMEDCFPYTSSDQDCSEMCGNPQERIKIDNTKFFYGEEDKKREIINGATSASIFFLQHVMQIIGYKVLEEGDNLYVFNDVDTSLWITIENNNPLIGQTAWLCKNSWGDEWGDNGYVYLIGDKEDIRLYSLYGPVSSLIFKEDYVLCTDNDGDGYYSWGIGPKPSHCPESPDEPDGDDTDRCIGPMDEYGNFKSSIPTPDAKDTIILYGQMVPDLIATGSNILWYSDKKLLNLVHTGNEFTTGQTEIGDYTYYVTQTVSGCESEANAVSLSIWLEIPRPLGHDTVICAGKPAILTVTGKQGAIFKWYEDPLLTTLLHTGDSFETQKTDSGAYTYYVTQSLWLFDSAPDTVILKIHDPPITIPDIAFLYALIDEGVDTYGDGLISYDEAESVTSINVSGKGIADMAGIEAFVNLETLNCSANQLTSLDVSNCTALERLYCYENQLTSLDVSNNTALERLYCYENQLTSLDVSNNTAISRLQCSGNQLTSLDVSNNTALEWLYCYENQLTSLDVSNCTALRYLYCYENQLTSLDVSNCTALKYLYCYENQLTSLDVSNNNAISRLQCSGNKLTSLDVSFNTDLDYLSCGDNQLTNLDVSNKNSLNALSIDEMPTLGCVSVWVLPFPPEGVEVDTTGSPNVYFTRECDPTLSEYKKVEFNIYPNPITDLLTIETNKSGSYTIEITSLNDQLLYSTKMNGPTQQIDISSFQKGLYFITIRSRDFVRTEKIIKL